MTNNVPLVSVLMTAYNRQQFIAEAIESVLASTFENWELIIVDDGSKDNTVSIARDFANKDKRIKVYINEKNLGDYPNRNRAAGYAKGEYLMYVDSDDQLYADSLQKAVDIMVSFPKAGYGTAGPLQISEPKLMDSREVLRHHFFNKPILMYGPGAMIIRNDFFKLIKGFSEKYGPANDMYFHLKAASAKPLVLLPFEMVKYRRHDGQEINNHFSYLSNNYLYQKDALSELNLFLNEEEKKYLNLKNKRRYAVNVIKFFFKTGSLPKIKRSLNTTKFTLRDFLEATFHHYSHGQLPIKR